ncbi:hypothetical protein [Microbacterium testaceum]|uniref:hypothetical protein n=1 Tax=Microbacterium testaceum TaxID=2033 RepID=UPI0012487D5A|nr:hypothetical protein [Microbacterium testaceum]
MLTNAWTSRVTQVLLWTLVVTLGVLGFWAIRHDGNVGVAFMIAALVLAAPAAKLSEASAAADPAMR